MYNKRQTGAENWRKESLASNQVVGGSNPSGRANLIKHLGHLRKSRVSRKCLASKVVIGSWGAIVGSILSIRGVVEEDLGVDTKIVVRMISHQPTGQSCPGIFGG
ncbi:MAG TPA: hypothetical protein EYN14_04230 [Alphaproteobacteria bacterium]|nr:hypothetical protein [Alphaproteobacteria bacterium]